MGLLNSALQIGRNAILSYQGALQAVGSNISSAGSPDYTRLSPQLDPLQGSLVANDLQPGAGVALTDIQRNIDDALEGRLRLSIGGFEHAAARQSATAQVESFFDDLSGAGAGANLMEFFARFDDLQNTPEDPALRDLVVSSGSQLADSLRSMRVRLAGLGRDLDSQITDMVEHADDVVAEIARLNSEITTGEAGRRGQATALRDQRDALLRELSEMFEVTVREQADGSVNVYAGSEALVQGAMSRGLVAVTETDGEFVRTSVRFADTGQQLDPRSGRLAGLIIARDVHAYGQVASIDQLAAGLIAEVNRVHADGQGLKGIASMTGSVDVLSTTAALDSNEAGLTNRPRDGSFYVTVSDDATGTPVAYRIDVTLDGTSAGMTLDGLVAAMNAQIQGVTASVTSDRRLSLQAATGYSFTFGHDGQVRREDTSGILAALGVNTFFSGSDAHDIAVEEALVADGRLVAAAASYLPGDGTNAGRIAALESTASDRLNGLSALGFYNAVSGTVAVTAAGANDDVRAADSVLASLQAQKESISGVNLDEEAIALLKYERAFQGAARYVTAVDEMIAEVVALIR